MIRRPAVVTATVTEIIHECGIPVVLATGIPHSFAVRRTGIATNDEELESALRSIAAPVRSRSGQVVAAVNVAIPWSPVAISELVSQLGPTIQATAKQIAAKVI